MSKQKISNLQNVEYSKFLDEIKDRIRSSQYEAMREVNRQTIALYWEIGRQINIKRESSGWGKAVVENLSRDIQKEFPGIQGFGTSNLWYMAQWQAEYNGNEILQPLVGEISWTKHIVILTKCKDVQERRFYIQATKKFGWTKDVLIHKIELKTFEKVLLGQTNFETNLPEENPSIGIIICKSKDRTTVDYALRSSNMPIGVATYTLTNELPGDLKNMLPEGDEIARKLDFLFPRAGTAAG